MIASELEEQQEKLRRAVDGWRCQGLELLKDLRGGSCSAAAAAADSRCASSRPVEIHLEPLEHSGIHSLLDSDNVDVSKFVMVLSYDCIEVARLRRHACRRIFRKLLLFGQRSSSQEVLLEGEPQKAVGQSLSLFMDLYETVSRMSAVLKNLLQQLNSLYSEKDKNSRPHIFFNSVSLRNLFESFAEGMGTLLVLDEILKQNTRIKGHLSQFRRMLSKVKQEIDTFHTSAKDLDYLEKVVCEIEKLLDAGLFQCTLRGGTHLNDILQKATDNRKLIGAFTSWTHEGLLEILPLLDTWKEQPAHRRRILQHIAIFTLSVNAFGEAPEKKLGKVITDILHKAPVIYIECGIRFKVLELIEKHCPQLLTSWSSLRGVAKDSDLMLKNYLSSLTESHTRDWKTIKNSLSCWLVSFLATIHPMRDSSTSHADFKLQLRQIIQGILLAGRMYTLAMSMIDLHSLLEVPVRREKFKALCHMLILLKAIANTFCAKRLQLIQCLPHVINLIQGDIEGLLLPAKLRLEATKGGQQSKIKILSLLTHGGKDADAKLADSLSLVQLCIRLLQGNGSFKRQQILSIALDVLSSIGQADVDFIRIRKLMWKLDMAVDFQTVIEELTDCSFLYWRKEMLRDWLNMVYTDDKISWLQYLLDAFSDGLRHLNLGNAGKSSRQSYEKQLEEDVTNEIVQPLCRDIENDLRLHVHSVHLKGPVNVNLTETGVRNLSWYLQMRPLHLPFKFIDVRMLVESYLNSVFYNHAAMALYDWKVYSKMRQLAELKYGLLLDDSNPSCPDLHFTEIIADIPSFFRNYSHDLVKQIFMEKVGGGQERKTSAVLGVDHVVAAISALGLTLIGDIMEKVVDILTKKLQKLSDLLDDDVLRSLVSKEKSWKGEKGKPNPSKYPFARAEQLSATLGRLSSRDGDISIVDQLHSAITEIGNGVGFVRLLHTGGSRHAPQTFRLSRTPMDGKADESDPTFDDVSPISRLLSAVSKELERRGGHHLVDFCNLVPALIVNLTERRLHGEKPQRREREPGNHPLPDDGFILGTCFVLMVTGEDKSFEELNWFASASKHLDEALSPLGHGIEQPPKESKVFGFKLWTNRVVPPVSPESHKARERLWRRQREMALAGYGFDVARAIVSLGQTEKP